MNRDESRDDVLFAFTMEPQRDRKTLDRYLAENPELASDLIDISSELRLRESQPKDNAKVIDDPECDDAWNTLVAAQPQTSPNPFAAFQGREFVELCKSLRLPRSIVAAFRDRLVDVETIPDRLMDSLAACTATATDAVTKYLAQPPTTAVSMEFKSGRKPTEVDRVTFQQLIENTQLSDDQRDAITEYLGDGQSN